MCSGVMKSILCGHKYFSNDKLLTDTHNLFHDLRLRENLPYTSRTISFPSYNSARSKGKSPILRAWDCYYFHN